MGKPQYFLRNDNKGTSTAPSKPINWTKWLLFTLMFVLVIGVLTYGGFKVKSALDSVSANWSEIQFAMEKPALVKAVREDYQKKQAKLEAEFLTKEKSSEEKLVDEVVKRLETAEDLK